MKVLAVIPARGGSKGIPRKNLADVGGLPLLAWSIRHARQAQQVDRVVVSSEDEEICAVARQYGAEVPFQRPLALAGDDVLDLPVFTHALRALRELDGYEPDLVVHLRPTAPLRRPGWIDAAVDVLARTPAADSVRSVSRVEQHPYRMFEIGADGFLAPLLADRHPTPYLLRRQDLPPVYYYNCVIDVTRPRTILQKNSMTGDRIVPFVLDASDVFDVDTPRDLEIARLFAAQFG